MSFYRQRLLLAFAVIGAFLIAGLLGSISGTQGSYWDWQGRGSFFATFAAVQVTYFAAPRYKLLFGSCVLVFGGIFSRAISEYLWHFVGYSDGFKEAVIPHFMGGFTGLSMAVVIKRCSTLNFPTFRQWLLAPLAVFGAFLTAPVLASIVTAWPFDWVPSVRIFCATLAAVLLTYFAVPRYRIFSAFCVFALLAIDLGTVSKAPFHPLRNAMATYAGGFIGLFVALLVNRRSVPSPSSLPPWFLSVLALVGIFIVGAIEVSLPGHSFWATLAAVLVTYFAAPRYGLVLALCTFVLGALLSYMFAPSPNFGDAQSTYVRAIANCMGGITGLFLIVVAKDCSKSDVSAFRQRLLIAFAVIGVFVAAGIFGSIAANRLGYWDLPPRPYQGPLYESLVPGRGFAGSCLAC